MRSTGVKLTAFTLFTIFVTFWLASIIGNIQLFNDTYEVTARFSDATGILNGDPVKIGGVTIGKVVHFEVADGIADIEMQLEGDVDYLPENTVAEVKYRNLLGQRVINLVEPEEPSDEVLADGDTIPVENTVPALDLSTVFENLRPLIQSTNPEEINRVARAVLKVFKGREGDFAGILGNLGDISNTLTARDQRLARLIGNLNGVTKILNRQSGDIRTSLSRFSEVMDSLARVTPTISSVVDELNTASSKFGGILTRNRANLDQEIGDLNIILSIVNDNLAPLDKIAKNLKEVLLATARSQSYGEWWTLYVVNLCPETGLGGCGVPVGGDAR
ncbi:MAG TPA: MCE family protein [Actinomycetota bacterium]|jgi:phospholipid/cholesterol/gamma-HCH transport system substrate-binding protein